MGKTQTVLAYAHQRLEAYTHVCWVDAASRETLTSGYIRLAGLLKLPTPGGQSSTQTVDSVKQWLASHQGWLLVLDNADDLGLVREFLPSGNCGHVVLTTRAWALGALAQSIEVQKMGHEEGALLLLRRAKRIPEDALLEAADPIDQARAKEIATQLDGLPLALDQAAAYLEETGCRLVDYLQLYRQHAPELLRRRGALASTRARWFETLLCYLHFWRRHARKLLRQGGVLASDHPDAVASTWVLSFEQIERASSAAAELLKLCAFLHPDRIPEELFVEGAPELGPALKAVGSEALAWNNALSEILKYSLLQRDTNAGTLEVHQLVQAVLKARMDAATQRRWAKRAVRAIARAFPSVEFSNWARCERLLPQAHAAMELINEWGLEFPEAARLLNRAGFYLSECARYPEAEPLYRRALAIREKALGPEHPNVATALENYAFLLRVIGRPDDAAPMETRARAIRAKSC